MRVAHFSFDLRFGYEGRDGVNNEYVDRSTADKGVRDLERFLSRVRLRDEECIDIDSEVMSVDRVDRVFCIDESGYSTGPSVLPLLCDIPSVVLPDDS